MGNKTRHTANLVSDNNLFVDIANDRVGIGSTQPTAKLNVAGIVSATSFIGDGSQLSGVTVTGNASLQQLTVSGNITANGNIVGDNSTNITGISGVTASTLTGTLQTAAQTNITSVGTLGSLTVSGNITANGNIVGDNATNISGVNQVTATTFSGSGASLTGLTGASAATYGGASVSPQITVDANGRITSITNVSIAGGGGGGGTSIIVQDSQSLVGAAGTIDFGTGLSVSAISAGVATVTAAGISTAIINADTIDSGTLNVTGVSTFTNTVNLNDGATIPAGDSLDFGTDFSISRFSNQNKARIRYTGPGDFTFEIDDVDFRNSANNETLMTLRNGGGVSLYHNNNIKLSSTTTGVTITGTATATTFSGSGASLTNLPAANLTGTLPAISGANLTNLDASDLASGTIPDARFPATLPTASGANLTTLNASELDSGTIPDARFPSTLPAVSGANLTNLPAPTPADTDVQVTFDVSSNGSSAYRITGPGYSGADDNPDIYLVRGQRYRFINGTGSSHPFRIQSDTSGTAYTDGVSGSQSGTQDFNVQHDAPVRLYYQCTIHSGMIGNIYIVGGSDWRMTDVATNATPDIFTFNDVGIGTDNPNSLGKLSVVVPTTGGAGAINVQNHAQGSGLSNIVLRSLDNNGGNWAEAEFRAEGYSFKNRTTERLSITSGGNIRIPEATATSGRLQLGASQQLTIFQDSANAYLANDDFIISNGAVTEVLARFRNGGAVDLNYDNSKKFETTSTGVSVTGNLAFASGNGIDFSATSNSSGSVGSEVFDDYEEGTWTPQITGGMSGTPSYQFQIGWYTKIGRIVTLYFYLRFSSSGNTGSNSIFRVGNFPFPVASNHQNTYNRGMGVSNYHSIPGFTSANIGFYGGGSSNTYASTYQGSNPVATSSAVNGQYIIGGFEYISE